MNTNNTKAISIAVTVAVILAGLFIYNTVKKDTTMPAPVERVNVNPEDVREAMFANGCFWCVESDLMKVNGVIDVVSGYAGGEGESPTYENYASAGFREVVQVQYDSSRVSYANLVEHILKHGDPTDGEGSFGDRGEEYAPAIYYANSGEQEVAQTVISKVEALNVFSQPLAIEVLPTSAFYAAEEYHQNYADKSTIKYSFYRKASGRDAFIEKYWGDESGEFTVTDKVVSSDDKDIAYKIDASAKSWLTFEKPSDDVLRSVLTDIEYEITQNDGTETPFTNEYDDNKEAGIYVDILSGEPLYSSKDKYDSGTGWPSFTKPIVPDALITKPDNTLFTKRTETRSRYADNHIGHVFSDGPADRGGMRWCMNSAAMNFIAKDDMAARGYGDYLQYVE